MWQPSPETRAHSNLQIYADWLSKRYGWTFEDYESLWGWSITESSAFWESMADFFQIQFHAPFTEVMTPDAMPETQWFTESELNYAEHIFRMETNEYPALIHLKEGEEPEEMSWEELRRQVASLAQWLREKGIAAGDRIVGYLPNGPEATVSFLAACSIGAVWSSCSPDFGSQSVVDRFRQIEPQVLIACPGYRYGGKHFNRMEVVWELAEQLPSLEHIVLTGGEIPEPAFKSWYETQEYPEAELTFQPVPFDHPIWVLYSSGTTGKPKAIAHSQGGVLLEHFKYLVLHNDVKPGERFFWYTTTGWMMWNFLQAALLGGATIVLYDGSPGYPDLGSLWKLAESVGIHHFGTSAPFLEACRKEQVEKRLVGIDLSELRSIGSTGAPLSPQAFDWVYEKLKPDVWLCSMSGGTDVCTAFVGGCPWLPVYRGEIQARCLGVALHAWDEEGNDLINEVGEMVITKPLPSMPIYFWNDPGKERYRSSYFEHYPGVWRHGDWIELNERGSLSILGRSDATLNRQGIRIGTAEIYQAVHKVSGIRDSLVVHFERKDGSEFMPLFVLLEEGMELSEDLKKAIRRQLKEDLSPRHVPDEIIAVPDIPYTISGKKLEKPIKEILMGEPPGLAANPGAMRNPESLAFFVEWGRQVGDS